jgi:hypothetical protein
MYTVRARVPSSTISVGDAISVLWNPHATQRITLVECAVWDPTSGTVIETVLIRRMTTRGTPGSTITPGVQHHSRRAIAPPSGALLDMAGYSVEPTPDSITTIENFAWSLIGTGGGGMRVDLNLVIPPGDGVGLVASDAAVRPFEVEFVWYDGYRPEAYRGLAPFAQSGSMT